MSTRPACAPPWRGRPDPGAPAAARAAPVRSDDRPRGWGATLADMSVSVALLQVSITDEEPVAERRSRKRGASVATACASTAARATGSSHSGRGRPSISPYRTRTSYDERPDSSR